MGKNIFHLENLLTLFRNPEFHLKTKQVHARYWRKEARAVLDMTRFSMFLSTERPWLNSAPT